MTVEEHLNYYARIKGIKINERVSAINNVVTLLELQDHKNKTAGTLSGGNKRKLCVAIAVLGGPKIILLDEPSAGMDPEARRYMWKVVSKISSDKTSAVVLTTHSMDEAETLSSSLGIMVKGGIFKCYGSSQHIKNKFGKGVEIELKIRQPKTDEFEFEVVIQELKDVMKENSSDPISAVEKYLRSKSLSETAIEQVIN